MPTLKEPQKSIPNGFRFRVVETKWEPTPYSSLDSIVTQLIEHRKGQVYLTAKNGWSLDPAVVYAEVLQYNVAVCQQLGYTDYLLGGDEAAVPFTYNTPRSLLQKARAVAGGVETLVSWKSEGAPTVPQELADARARKCCSLGPDGAKCPLNGSGGLEAYFTVPAQQAIKRELEKKREMKLATTHDDKLGVCEGCDCPLPLKVWMPLENILAKMKPETQARLHPHCWIVQRDA